MQNLNPHIPADRTILHTVHTDDGYVELYWSRANDDFANEIEGSLLFHRDGSITWKGWTNDEKPISLVVRANRIVVSEDEDQHDMGDRLSTASASNYIIFDSEGQFGPAAED